jgi:hypothetical protein
MQREKLNFKNMYVTAEIKTTALSDLGSLKWCSYTFGYTFGYTKRGERFEQTVFKNIPNCRQCFFVCLTVVATVVVATTNTVFATVVTAPTIADVAIVVAYVDGLI